MLAPVKDTGRGSGTGPALAASPLRGDRRAVSPPAKSRPPKVETNCAAGAAAPPIGTGGAAGALRMSSMLWMGVMPQIGSREKGQP